MRIAVEKRAFISVPWARRPPDSARAGSVQCAMRRRRTAQPVAEREPPGPGLPRMEGVGRCGAGAAGACCEGRRFRGTSAGRRRRRRKAPDRGESREGGPSTTASDAPSGGGTIRRPDACGPASDDAPGWTVRRGSACAFETRACSCAAAGSADRFASRSLYLGNVVGGPDVGRQAGLT